jgi:hypothetical protein
MPKRLSEEYPNYETFRPLVLHSTRRKSEGKREKTRSISGSDYAEWNEPMFSIAILHAAGVLGTKDERCDLAYRQLSGFVEWLRREENRRNARILRTRSMGDIERLYELVVNKRRQSIDEKEFLKLLEK